MPCGQIGRFVQTWTSVTSPMAPSQIHSLISRAPSLEWPWLPIWVTTFSFFAVLGQQPGFLDRMGQRLLDNRRACRVFIAAMAMTAWVWSGVVTVIASKSFSLSSISRKSRYLRGFVVLGLPLGRVLSGS